jgi:hypothetical protein
VCIIFKRKPREVVPAPYYKDGLCAWPNVMAVAVFGSGLDKARENPAKTPKNQRGIGNEAK